MLSIKWWNNKASDIRLVYLYSSIYLDFNSIIYIYSKNYMNGTLRVLCLAYASWEYVRNVDTGFPGSLFRWPRGLRRGSRLLACWDYRFESPRGHGYFSAVSVVCCQKEPTSGWSLLHRNPTECGASECDHEASKMTWTCLSRGCCSV